MPTMVQAGVYSATIHYLKAVKALGSKDPLKVMEKMRETPINDFMTHNGRLRIDGRVLRDMYLLQVMTCARKMMVEFFSTEISAIGCRVRSRSAVRVLPAGVIRGGVVFAIFRPGPAVHRRAEPLG